ncbi:MAG: alpha/beta fold hydrolase [Thermoanaerobaculales bacterium]
MTWPNFRRGGDRLPTLYCDELGVDGPPIVFLPGIGGTTRYWRTRVAPLAHEHRLLLVDLLGYGRSPKPWTRYSVERHVEELHRILHGRGPLTLVGHSFGAIAAVAFAARHPGLVRSLVLIALPYFGSEERALRHFRDRPSADRFVMTNVAFAAITCIVTRRVLRRLLPYVLRDMPAEVVEDLVRHTWRSYTSTMWEGVYRHDLADDAARLAPDLPVLCLHGELDTTAPLEGVRRLVADHPRWTVRVLRGGDHHPFLRDPEWCLEAIATGS